MDDESGRVIVLTGTGKGKTTSALGQALRALGHGMRVAVVQFIKGPWETGEGRTLKRLAPEVLFVPMGRGFVRRRGEEPDPEDVRAAEDALARAREIVCSGDYGMVVLDEVNYAVHYRLLTPEDILQLIDEKPAAIHLVLTGAYAPGALTDRADLVTEMTSLKHPFDNGAPPREGIEY